MSVYSDDEESDIKRIFFDITSLVYTGYSLWWIIWIYSSEVAPFPQFHLYFPLAFYLFFTKNDHILMHPFMCARIIHHLVVVGHILHNFTSAQNLNTYKNILHDFVHKLWLFCLVLSKNILLLLPVWVGCWSWIYRPHWIYS